MPLDELIIVHSKTASEMTSDHPTVDNRRTGRCSKTSFDGDNWTYPRAIFPSCAETACCELHAWDKGYASQKPAQQSRGNTLSVSNGTANLLACLSLRLELKPLYQGHMISTRSQTRDVHSKLIVTCLWLITPSEHPLLAQRLGQKVKKSCTDDYTHQWAHGYVICIWTTAWLVLESLVLPSTRVSDRVLVYKCLFLHTPWHLITVGGQKETAWHTDANGASTWNNLGCAQGKQPANTTVRPSRTWNYHSCMSCLAANLHFHDFCVLLTYSFLWQRPQALLSFPADFTPRQVGIQVKDPSACAKLVISAWKWVFRLLVHGFLATPPYLPSSCDLCPTKHTWRLAVLAYMEHTADQSECA